MPKVQINEQSRKDARNLDDNTERWKIRKASEVTTPVTAFKKTTAKASAKTKDYFYDLRSRRSKNTLRAHDNDLEFFAAYLLNRHGVSFDLINIPSHWAKVTPSDVEGFIQKQIEQGYTFNTTNRRLATIRLYIKLAYQQSLIGIDTYLRIQAIKAFFGKEQTRLDKMRTMKGVATRRIRDNGTIAKKASFVEIPETLIHQIKNNHDDSPIGHRDRLLICLLMDLGLRANEVCKLRGWHIDYKARTITVQRVGMGGNQKHQLTDDIMNALNSYIANVKDFSLNGTALLRQGKKSGVLTDKGITTRTVSRIVREIGERHGLNNLSANDCRHSWATRAINAGTPLLALMQAGGWKNVKSVMVYIHSDKIVNEAIQL